MASRSLDDLHPAVKARAIRFQSACKDEGIDVLIYCTHRSNEEQNELYLIGRKKPGRKVTNARGGESLHNHEESDGKPASLAFDFVPMVGGKPAWADAALYRRCGVLAEKVGLEWAGRWSGDLKETAHCQYTGGKSFAAIKAGAAIT